MREIHVPISVAGVEQIALLSDGSGALVYFRPDPDGSRIIRAYTFRGDVAEETARGRYFLQDDGSWLREDLIAAEFQIH